MKSTIPLLLWMLAFAVSACAPQATAGLTPLPPTQPAEPTATQAPSPLPPTEAVPQAAWKQYTNSAFGLGFQYPSEWYGPDEYISEQTLRVAVGSDVVYPYGTGLDEQVYTLKDSYYITLQYTKNDRNQVWKDTYQSLAGLQDGETLSEARSLVIRVRQVRVGRFEGIEYITTLSDTAQTEPVYIRQVILFDDQANVLTIMGTPNNVEIGPAGWRDAYYRIDAANVDLFHRIVETITLE